MAHDSGTYAIGDTGINEYSVRDIYGRTQEVNIYNQLMAGIRYFDKNWNKDKEIYLTHNSYDCIDRVTGKKYYIVSKAIADLTLLISDTKKFKQE